MTITNQARTILWWFAASTFLGLASGLLTGVTEYGWGMFFAALALGMFAKTMLVYLHGPAYTPAVKQRTFLDATREEERKDV